MDSKNYDLVIIGGGAAGIMSAISCKKHHPECKVAIIDRTFALGRKILVAGAGRCNITNINLDSSAENRYYGAEKDFIKSIFTQFNYQDIVEFFNELGIELYLERKTNIGKLFPITDQAKTITSLLEDELNRLKVDIFLNNDCEKITKLSNEKFEIISQPIEQNQPKGEKVKFESRYLIISAGGKTYPALGSNGSGYTLAQSLGHNIIGPVPSALPLEGKNPLSHELQGVKFEIEVTSFINREKIKTTSDDVMFTQYGLSGPAILNISREISIHINREGKNQAEVMLNFFPNKNINEVKDLLQRRWNKRPDQSIEKSLFGLFPNKISSAILNISSINKEKQVKTVTSEEMQNLLTNLTSYRIQITGTKGWNEAEFTAGGVDASQLYSTTLESKLCKNLYFCGEIMDVDGDVGGFNLSWAWSSGFVAGSLK